MRKKTLSMLFLTLLSGPLALSSSAVQAGDPSCTDSCCQYPDVCAEACGDGCGDACGESCCSLFGDCGGGIAGLIKKSDHCFDDFISPMTNPVFFEDPRTLTEARLIYANHNLPNALGGNNVQIVAMQLRGAITDDLSIIATKDGYIISDNPLLDDGWADVAAGLKLNVYKNYETQTIASVGTTFELPVGSQRSLQGNGDGEFHMFASGGTEFLDDYHWISGAGWRLPVDQDAESTSVYWSNHVDRKIGDSGFYLLGECNWFHWVDGGNGPLPVEGQDFFNLGSAAADGNSVVTGALGVKYKPTGNTELGFAYEIPLTDREDILDDRYTVDWILRY